MEDKIAALEASVKNTKSAIEYVTSMKPKLEEKMKEAIEREKNGLYAIRVLTQQKLILQKRIAQTDYNHGTTESEKVGDLASPDVSQGTDLTLDAIKNISRQIQEYPEFTRNAKKMVEQLRAELPEKKAKVKELQAKCEQSDKIIREMIQSNSMKNLEMETKLRSLKMKNKNLEEKISSLKTVLQEKKDRIKTMEEQRKFLEENYDQFIKDFEDFTK